MMVAQQLYEGHPAAGRRSAGRSHHLHAHRLGARRRSGARRSARPHRHAVRRRLRARAAEPLQGQVDRAGRARSDSADVDGVSPRVGARASDAGPVLPLSADLEPVRRVADDAGACSTTRRWTSPPATTCSAPRARCRSSPAGWRSTARAPAKRTRASAPSSPRAGRRGQAETDDEPASGVLPALSEGQTLDVRAITPEQKFTQPPPRFNEGVARQGARRERHRPAEHLRVDHQRAAGARLREQDRRPVPADDSRPPPRRQAAASGVRRHPRRRVHGADGRPARRHREGQGRLQGDARRPSTRASRRT